MGLFDKFSPNLPLLKGSLGLLAAGERGDSTGLALGQGLLGYTQTRADIKAADALKAEKALERKINQAKLAQIQAQTGQLNNPPAGQRKTIQGADGFHYYVDTGERVLPNVQKTLDPTSAQNDYLLAQQQGFKGSFLDYKTALANASRTQINNNINSAPPYKIPENHMLVDPADPNKGVKQIPGSAVDVDTQDDLARAQDEGLQTLDLIDKIRNHPGRELSTGGSSWLGDAVSVIPGTDAKDFHTLLEQLQGKQFLAAYQTLKGGGQITEVEGEKAEQAIANMKTAQSESQFLESLNQLEEVVRSVMARADSKAGVTKRRRYNSKTGELE